MPNQTLMPIPHNVENPIILKRFLLKLIENLDIVLGYRGESGYVTTTDISSIEQQLSQLSNAVANLSTDSDSVIAAVSSVVEGASASYIEVSSNHTTSGNEVIEVTATCTITLSSAPMELESVSVHQSFSGGKVTIVGTINDNSSGFDLELKDESIDLIWNGTDSWISL